MFAISSFLNEFLKIWGNSSSFMGTTSHNQLLASEAARLAREVFRRFFSEMP